MFILFPWWCCRELNKALLLNGTFMKLRKLKKLMRKFDVDGSGSLSFEVPLYIEIDMIDMMFVYSAALLQYFAYNIDVYIDGCY